MPEPKVTDMKWSLIRTIISTGCTWQEKWALGAGRKKLAGKGMDMDRDGTQNSLLEDIIFSVF